MILNVNKTEVEFKLDTGTQANIIAKNEFCKLEKNGKICPTNAKLITYDGSRINVVRKCILRVGKINRKSYPTEFMTVDTIFLGLRSYESLNRVKRVFIVNDSEPDILKLSDTFGDIGCLPGEYKIEVDP